MKKINTSKIPIKNFQRLAVLSFTGLSTLIILLLVPLIALHLLKNFSLGQVRASCSTGQDIVTHGPFSGAVTDSSVKIWVRTCETADTSVFYKQESQTWDQAATSSTTTADPLLDYTSVVAINNLLANTRYNYQIHVNGQQSTPLLEGKFKTMPADESSNKLNFLVGTDLHLPANDPTTLLLSALNLNPDFGIIVGDNVIMDQPVQFPPPPASQAEYETKYKDSWSNNGVKSFRSNISTYMMWDDHEIINDWDQKTNHPYPWARNAYEEYINSYNPANRPGGGVNYIVKAGDVEFYVPDTRTFRSLGEDPDGPNKTMLGAEQKQDLKYWLSNSPARFKFIFSSVWWTDLSRHAQFFESWPAFKTERDEIFNYIKDNKISGVILLSGDEHSTGVFKLPPWNIYEFTPGPISWAVDTPQVDPQILYKSSWTRSFGYFETNTVSCPGTARMEMKSQNGQTRYTLNLNEFDLGATNLNAESIDLPGIPFDDITNPIGDNKPDTCDPDMDHDGLTSAQEQQAGTDPKNQDSDGDGTPDGAEKSCSTNPLNKLSTLMNPLGGSKMPDKDYDSLPDYCEAILGTNPNIADSDGDGLTDGAEVNWGADPLVQDSDQDGCRDDLEAANLNNNKIINSTDQLIIAQRFNATRGSTNYVRDFDINQDGKINSTDQLMVAQRFNKTCP